MVKVYISRMSPDRDLFNKAGKQQQQGWEEQTISGQGQIQLQAVDHGHQLVRKLNIHGMTAVIDHEKGPEEGLDSQ